MNKIAKEIIEELANISDSSDISDIGNAIGIIIGETKDIDPGDFIAGFNHGVSISNGTHNP